MLRVLLIHPPENKFSIAPGRLEPLGLEVLAACIPNHDVHIIDLRVDTYRELDFQLRVFNPQVAGLSVNNTIHVPETLSLLRYLREKLPRAATVVGGHHPTMIPRDFHIPEVDFIFLGWAEKSFPAFLQSFENGNDFSNIHGIEVLQNGRYVFRSENPFNLKESDIPYPRRDLVARYLKSYRSDAYMPTGLVNSTRGCANRCTFCSVWKSSNGFVIVRKPEDVFHEISTLPKGVKHVFFADDNSFLRPDNQHQLYKLIKEHNIKLKYSGYCRSDTIIRHPELMAEWKEIGLENLCVGFESTDDSYLVNLNKKNGTANNEEAARILNRLGISFRPHFLIEPSFVKADFERISKYVHQLRLDSPIFPILTPIPGTQSYEEAREQIILDYNYFDYAHAVTPTRLPVRQFYLSWLSLFLKCYSFKITLGHFLRKQYGRMIGDSQIVNEHHHMSFKKLFMLKILYVFLKRKLHKHCRMIELRASGKLAGDIATSQETTMETLTAGREKV